jgi:hypothetical protein
MTPSNFVLEQLVSGDLPEAEAGALRAAAASDPQLAARIARLETDSASFLAAHPSADVVPSIERRLHLAQTQDRVRRGHRRRWWTLALGLPVAAAAAGLLAMNIQPMNGSLPPDVEWTQPKGGAPTLKVHRKTRRGEERLRDGATVGAGDLLQLGYDAGTATHGVVLSVDGSGVVTLHHPADVRASTELESGGHLLPDAYELDAAPSFERFFFVTSNAPVDVADVRNAAKKWAKGGYRGTLNVPHAVHSLRLVKAAR